jgi:hypothetical protein
MPPTVPRTNNARLMIARGVEPNRPLRLPDLRDAVRAAVDLAGEAAFALEELHDALDRVDEPLAERIERNRARSRRYRLTGKLPHAGNSHQAGDDRLTITKAGVVLQCRRCDRVLAVQATPANGNGIARRTP